MNSNRSRNGFVRGCRCLVWVGMAWAAVACYAAENPQRLPKVRVAENHRAFETAEGRSFVPFGVNYFRPGTGWAPKLWQRFDAEATRRDLAQLKQLGATCVRVFLTYGSFYTERDKLNDSGLEKFDQFLSLAEEAGIYVHPTGPDHWEGVPDWVPRDRYAEEQMLVALEHFWQQLVSRYRNRNVIFAYDLLNEPSIPWNTPAMRDHWNQWLRLHYDSPQSLADAWQVNRSEIRWGEEEVPSAKNAASSRRLLDYQHCREAVADEWTRRQADAIHRQDPHALVTVGLIQWSFPVNLPGVQQYSAFRPEHQAKFLDFVEFHFYPLATGFYEYTPEGEVGNLAYLECLAGEAARCGKPVVLAEYGWYGGGKLTINEGRHPAASEDDQARWCRRAVETTEGPVCGWLNWGFHDHPEARDVTQLTGLLTVDGRPKQWARSFQSLAQRFAQQSVASRHAPPRPELDWDRCLNVPEESRQYLKKYIEAYRQSGK